MPDNLSEAQIADEMKRRIADRRHPKDPIRAVLEAILMGYVIRENSYDKELDDYKISQQQAMTKAVSDDELAGRTIYLFGYTWSNDIIQMAAHFGHGIERRDDGRLYMVDIPAPVSDDCYWDESAKAWNYDEDREDEKAAPSG